ncbi:MAG: helix-turn-helix domain-containing protein [Dissulfurispiraceae bacterium]
MTAKELKEWRLKNGYTQAELGKILNVNKMTVYRWEAEMRAIPSFLHLALECVDKKGGEKET